MKSNEDYYLNSKSKYLKFCKTLIKGGSQALNVYGDREFAEDFRKEVPGEFEKLLPYIPYVGGREPWTRQLILTAWFIAVYKWMKKNNESIEDSWKLCSDMLELRLRNIPKPLRRMMRNSVFSEKQKRTYAKQAEEFKEKIYPEGDVFNYIEKQGGFNYIIEITECAKMTFAKKVDAVEFIPYICLVDKLWAEIFKYGLVRKGTIADGFEKCDFCLLKNGKVDVFSSVWNDSWNPVN
jgi:hypothetical protein